MSKHFILLILTLFCVVSISTAELSITMTGTPNWGAKVTLNFINDEDFQILDHLITLQHSPYAEGSFNWLGVDEISASGRTTRSIFCQDSTGNIVAELLHNDLNLKVFSPTKIISCPIRLPQPPLVHLTTGEPDLSSYIDNSIESITNFTPNQVTSVTISPYQWSFSTTSTTSTTWITSYEEDKDDSVFRDGYYTITASGAPKNTVIQLKSNVQFDVINSQAQRFGQMTLHNLFVTLFSLSSPSTTFHCNNGAMMKIAFGDHQLSSFEIITGDNGDISCRFPVSKLLFAAVFMRTITGYYSTDVTASLGFKTYGYGQLEPIVIGKVPQIEFAVSLLSGDAWALSLIGGKEGGKFTFKSSLSGEEVFRNGQGDIISSKLTYDALKFMSGSGSRAEDGEVDVINNDVDRDGILHNDINQDGVETPRFHQRDIAHLTSLLSPNPDIDPISHSAMMEQQFGGNSDTSSNGISMSYRSFKIGSSKKEWSVNVPHKGQTTSISMYFDPMTGITPTIFNYSLGSRDYSIRLHNPLTTKGDDYLPTLKYVYSNKKVTVTFTAKPVPQDLFASKFTYKAGAESPVYAKFFMSSLIDIRTSLFRCSADTSTWKISHTGQTLGLDTFLMVGSILPSGAVITCEADADPELLPYKAFSLAYGLTIDLSFFSLGQEYAALFINQITDQYSDISTAQLENLTALTADVTDKVTIPSGRNVIFQIWGEEINNKNDFDNVIKAALAVLNAKITQATEINTKTISPSDLCFALMSRPSWSSSSLSIQLTGSDGGEKYWKKGSFMKVGLCRGFADSFTAEQWDQFANIMAIPRTSGSIVIYPKVEFLSYEVTDVGVEFYNVPVKRSEPQNGEITMEIEKFQSQNDQSEIVKSQSQKIQPDNKIISSSLQSQQLSDKTYLINVIGGVPIGGACNTSSQCGFNSESTLSNTHFCVDNKCIGYNELTTNQRLEAIQITNDNSLSIFRFGPLGRGSFDPAVIGGNSSSLSIVMAFVAVVVAMIF